MLLIKLMIWMPMTLIVMNSTQPRLLLWRICPGMAQMHSLRYKEEVKDLKEMQNVENSFSGSNEQYAEIDCPDYEDSRALSFILHLQEFHILSFILGIQYPNLID
ncbi:hypothetical protein Tco_0770583 [Tanacetum coccineum]|uniref:Uncharacterized protein n=1 Tax=Tanacetum coccineum TaxID=301880 RepID=A0ABQ4ZDN8_9ASTR